MKTYYVDFNTKKLIEIKDLSDKPEIKTICYCGDPEPHRYMGSCIPF